MGKTRILVVSQLPPPVHGSTVMTQRFMEALGKCGFDSCIVERNFSRSQEDVERVTVGKVMKIPALCFRLIKAILSFRPTIVVFYITVGLGSFLVDCLLLFIVRIFGVDYVLYMHGRGLNRLGKEVLLPLRLIAKKTLSSSLGGIVLGESLKYDVKDYIADAYLAILPNGIPDSLRGRCIERKQTGEDGKIIILFLSNLIPSKGPMTFLQIAKTVIEQEKNVHFIMAGPTDSAIFTDSLKCYIRQNNLENVVSMPGGAYGEMKNKLFQEADIFVFPSTKEAFPVVNLEAMQWGLPVVSTFVGAIPDAVIDGVNGYLADPHDSGGMAESVLKLIRDPELRLAMGRNGRKRFEQEYSIEAFERKVKETMDFFIALQEQGRAGGR